MNIWINEWMNGWMTEWMNGCKGTCVVILFDERDGAEVKDGSDDFPRGVRAAVKTDVRHGFVDHCVVTTVCACSLWWL